MEAMTQVLRVETRLYGVDHPQYFPGVGTHDVDGDVVSCAMGIGFTPMDAIEDALDSLAQSASPAQLEVIDCMRVPATQTDSVCEVVCGDQLMDAKECEDCELSWFAGAYLVEG